MIARLTATILSLCIALPMCWCCVSAPAKEASCCAKTAHPSSHSQAPKDKNCPCAKHETARDVASHAVAIPAPEVKLVIAPVWQTAVLESTFLEAHERTVARHDHGPPRSTVPFYTRHCALLL